MQRCFELAHRGAGKVSPNPLVGAVLVHNGVVIGEGWHRQFGQAHAEVNCIASVQPDNRAFIPYSTLYCSLEPCSHHGKTPPCADLIIRENIPEVVVANTDPNPLVSGRGLEKMRSAGIRIKTGVLEKAGAEINRFFFTWIREKRPYVILKWAQSADGYMGRKGERTFLSGAAVRRLVHRWRYESDAVLVGAETVRVDDPVLDTRFYWPRPLLRVLLDGRGSVPDSARLLSDSGETLVFAPARLQAVPHKQFHAVEGMISPGEMLGVLAALGKAILFVEGGAQVLRQFLDSGYWDEIRQITAPILLGTGVAAPPLPAQAVLLEKYNLEADSVAIYRRAGSL